MIELLRRRRSIRKFTPKKISPETVRTLLEAALMAPSSRGIKPWEFILVDDPGKLLKISKAKRYGSEFLKNAPLGIVICADGTKSDKWVEDCSLAATIIQLTALSLGLGSCWVQIRGRQHDCTLSSESYVQSTLGLPEHIKVDSIVAVGHPAERKSPVASDSLPFGKIRYNGWAESGTASTAL